MAKSIEFEGMNRVFDPPPQTEEEGAIASREGMYGYSNGILTFTRWELSPEELLEVVKTGEIWLAVRCGTRPMQPHWLGSLSFIKQACADFGGLWRVRKPIPPAEDQAEVVPA